MAVENCYAILGVGRTATTDDIRRAYRQLAKTLHPDVNRGQDAAPRFAAIVRAYEVLSDPRTRRQHDHDLDTASARAAPVDLRAHYAWRNIATDATPSAAEPLADLDDLYDTFFGGDRGRV